MNIYSTPLRTVFGAVCLLAAGITQAVDNSTPPPAFSAASAGTVIYNTGNAVTATVAMGVNQEGHLNVPGSVGNSSLIGLAFKFPDGSWRDSTSPGCACEGWGVSGVSGATPHSGFANVSVDGVRNLTAGAATNVTGSTVTTNTALTSLPGLKVTHAYAPAPKASGALFMVTVTVTNNTGAPLNDVKYVRVMDWDVPPTEFNEYVTINGTGTLRDATKRPYLEESHDNGFNTANPLSSYGTGNPATLNIDFVDSGPNDHGAYFRFNLGDLANDQSVKFYTYYGAAATETAALTAIADQGVQLYSLGQSNGGQTTGAPATFVFGFNGLKKYDFVGFRQPVDNLPTVNLIKAGSAVPVKFSLTGNQGTDIFEAGYPKSGTTTCPGAGTPSDAIEETVTAGNSSLTYDALADQYNYVWKTDKSWAGTCRTLTLRLKDGTDHTAAFSFAR